MTSATLSLITRPDEPESVIGEVGSERMRWKWGRGDALRRKTDDRRDDAADSGDTSRKEGFGEAL